MGWINFLGQYIKSPRTVGAVSPSSKKLACKMMKDIDFSKCKCIVEYGPGTGVFTEQIIRRKKKDTLFLAIEYNEEFYKILKDQYESIENVRIIHDSAEQVKKYLNEYGIEKADYIVSGLPFASLPKDMSNNILSEMDHVLSKEGRFITFQYTKMKIKLFEAYFQKIDFEKVFFNLPPAYVLSCTTKDIDIRNISC